MRQKVIYIPEHEGPDPQRVRSAPCDEKPHRAWTLYANMGEPNNPPALPIRPIHNHNAFIEDYIHDWDVRGGRFIYSSRVTSGGCWVLLEYKE